jgi:rod shape determining protein RodA
MINLRGLAQFDYWLFLGAIAVASLGLVGVFSATTHGAMPNLHQRQLTWVVLGALVCLIVVLIDYHILIDNAFPIYAGMILVLIGVLIFGTEVNGSKSWVRVAGFNFQPSELAKIVVILVLSRYLTEINRPYLTRRDVMALAGLTLGPVVLVTMQGDLGTALTFVPILAGIMAVAGLRARFLVGVLIVVLCVAPIGWLTLKDYQKQRILVTMNPELDPQGVGYQTKQSLIAIGSGGITGKGFGEGLQGQLGFVPEIHSDFIFALLCEEQGLIGGGLFLALYLLGLLRLLRIGETARDRPGILIVTGIASLFFFHLIVNVGMTLGLLPAIGIPLPLLSYGGSVTLTTFAAIGLALSVHHRKFVHSDTLT